MDRNPPTPNYVKGFKPRKFVVENGFNNNELVITGEDKKFISAGIVSYITQWNGIIGSKVNNRNELTIALDCNQFEGGLEGFINFLQEYFNWCCMELVRGGNRSSRR